MKRDKIAELTDFLNNHKDQNIHKEHRLSNQEFSPQFFKIVLKTYDQMMVVANIIDKFHGINSLNFKHHCIRHNTVSGAIDEIIKKQLDEYYSEVEKLGRDITSELLEKIGEKSSQYKNRDPSFNLNKQIADLKDFILKDQEAREVNLQANLSSLEAGFVEHSKSSKDYVAGSQTSKEQGLCYQLDPRKPLLIQAVFTCQKMIQSLLKR